LGCGCARDRASDRTWSSTSVTLSSRVCTQASKAEVLSLGISTSGMVWYDVNGSNTASWMPSSNAVRVLPAYVHVWLSRAQREHTGFSPGHRPFLRRQGSQASRVRFLTFVAGLSIAQLCLNRRFENEFRYGVRVIVSQKALVARASSNNGSVCMTGNMSDGYPNLTRT